MMDVVEPAAPSAPERPGDRAGPGIDQRGDDRLDSGVDWRVVARGALIGFAVIVPVTTLEALLRHEIRQFDTSGWIYPLFVLVLVGYGTAGWLAGRARPDSPLMHGTLAGLGAFALWVPTRIVIWAIREDGRGLFSGDHAALRPGQLYGAIVIAASIGMLGAWLGCWIARRHETHIPS